MKKTITLAKAVELKKALEIARNEVYNSIKVLYVKDPTDSNIIELEESRNEIVNLVISLNRQIQEINLKKSRGESMCNVDNIKLLSEQKILCELLKNISFTDKVLQKAHIEKIKGIDREISTLMTKLSKFNEGQKGIKIEISQSILDLLTINLE